MSGFNLQSASTHYGRRVFKSCGSPSGVEQGKQGVLAGAFRFAPKRREVRVDDAFPVDIQPCLGASAVDSWNKQVRLMSLGKVRQHVPVSRRYTCFLSSLSDVWLDRR